jgi:hypothetical protein
MMMHNIWEKLVVERLANDHRVRDHGRPVMNQAMRSIQLAEGRVWIFADRDASATPGNGRTHGVQS